MSDHSKLAFQKPGSGENGSASPSSSNQPSGVSAEGKTARVQQVSQLSSRVSTMRFMLKASAAEEQEALIREEKKRIQEAQWKVAPKAAPKIAAAAAAVSSTREGASAAAAAPGASSAAPAAAGPRLSGSKRRICVADEESTIFSSLTGQALAETAESTLGGRRSFKKFNKAIENETNYSTVLAASDLTAEEIEAKLLHNRQKPRNLLDKQAAGGAAEDDEDAAGGAGAGAGKNGGKERPVQYKGAAGRFAGFKKFR